MIDFWMIACTCQTPRARASCDAYGWMDWKMRTSDMQEQTRDAMNTVSEPERSNAPDRCVYETRRVGSSSLLPTFSVPGSLQMNSKTGGFLSSRRLEHYDAFSCPGVLSFPAGCRELIRDPRAMARDLGICQRTCESLRGDFAVDGMYHRSDGWGRSAGPVSWSRTYCMLRGERSEVWIEWLHGLEWDQGYS